MAEVAADYLAKRGTECPRLMGLMLTFTDPSQAPGSKMVVLPDPPGPMEATRSFGLMSRSIDLTVPSPLSCIYSL